VSQKTCHVITVFNAFEDRAKNQYCTLLRC